MWRPRVHAPGHYQQEEPSGEVEVSYSQPIHARGAAVQSLLRVGARFARSSRSDLPSAGAPPAALPKKVDLRSGCPPVYDQGELGSCTANAIAGALQFDLIKQKMPDVFSPSRLFIY